MPLVTVPSGRCNVISFPCHSSILRSSIGSMLHALFNPYVKVSVVSKTWCFSNASLVAAIKRCPGVFYFKMVYSFFGTTYSSWFQKTGERTFIGALWYILP